MVTKTFSRYLSFFAFVIVLEGRLSGRATPNSPTEEKAQVTVSVYNEAAVPGEVLSRAEQAASRIFQRAGIEVNWPNCQLPAASEEASIACREAAFPKHLHLRIVRESAGLKAEAMGISFQGEDGMGCFADLFYEPMEKLRESDGTNAASLLGQVAAHELGHLLLGTNSHAAAGIMQARWTADRQTSPGLARMVFLDRESRGSRGIDGRASRATEAGRGSPRQALTFVLSAI